MTFKNNKNLHMKTLLIIGSAIGLFTLSNCSHEASSKKFLENPANRTEVFHAIQQNDKYMSEFMKSAKPSMQMMMKDTTMMNAMMHDGEAMSTMMQMMHKKGMMSEDCMQSCKTMMGEKGMNMKGMNGKMENTSSSGDDHQGHH